MFLPFPEYSPDVSPYGEEESQFIQNGLPRKDGYGPVLSPSVFSSALSGACRGYFFARNADASITIFAATATKLYKLNNTTLAWTDVSKGAGSYSTIPAADQWSFVQFNNFVIAVQINTAPQVFDLTSSTAFADLGGSPPTARYAAVVGRFVVLTGLGSTTPYRIQWSGLNAVTTWSSGVNSSDFQDFPDGGIVRGVAGAEYGATVFQDAALRRMVFVGGTLIFQFERISDEKGIFAPLSVAGVADNVYYCSTDGFKVIPRGGYPQPIGKERVDRTFFADVDSSSLQYVIGASEPQATRVYWSYKSKAGPMNQYDKVLVYDYALDRWGIIIGWGGQYLATLAVPGQTLEGMDMLAGGTIAVTGAANNGSGAIRLQLASEVANWTYGLADTTHVKGQAGTTTLGATQPTIEVYGVVGTTEANGNWHYTIFDGTHIDLTGSTFTNAYVSGGTIGGAVDALTFTLDAVALSSLLQLSIIDSSNRLNFITGPTLEGIFDSSEHQEEGGRRSRVRGFRPITDAPGCLGAVGMRENIQTPVSYSAEQAVNSKGLCLANVSTRMARGRIRIPAGTSWTFVQAIEPILSPEGLR